MNPNLFSKGLKYNYAHVVLPRLRLWFMDLTTAGIGCMM